MYAVRGVLLCSSSTPCGRIPGDFGEGSAQGPKLPFQFLEDAYDAITGQNGGAGVFVDKYLPVRPAYRLYRAEYMLRRQGCDALADLYAEAAVELTQQIVLVGRPDRVAACRCGTRVARTRDSHARQGRGLGCGAAPRRTP